MTLDTASVISMWIAALFTIWIYSIAFRDNVFFKFAEYTYVGAAAGHGIVYAFDNVQRYGWVPLSRGYYLYILVFVLGLMLFTRYHKRYYWLSRYPMAAVVGLGVGLSMRALISAQLVDQIAATAALKIVGVDTSTAFNNALFIIIVVVVTYYFIFSFPKLHAGKMGVIPKLARLAMMGSFGYAFGNSALTRYQMVFGRFDFLMNEWLPLQGAAVVFPIVLLLLVYALIPSEKRPWPKAKDRK